MGEWLGAAPLFCEPRRSSTARGRALPPSATAGSAGKEEEEARNRQKELQDLIVNAENVESILATVRELEGAIVISTALHRLGKVPVSPEVFKDSRFHLLLDRFRSRLPFFGSRQIANSLHGLGAICYRESGAWVEMVSIQTQRRIHEFEPQHVSNTLWACARMQLQEPLMLRALTSRAIEDIQRFCPLDISICTWAFATMKRREPEWLRAVVRARCEFGDFSPQNMSNFVWGLSTLGFRNDNMVLAVGREAAKKIQDFIPQELSNFSWALATMDLCDNLMLRAIAEEVDRRGAEVNTWDPQSLSNMMWAYATLALKDDPLFRRLLDASIERIADHDTQNLANSSWAAAMVGFRCSRWLDRAAKAAAEKIRQCQTLHLAQLAFAFSRFVFRDGHGFLPALLEETLRRVEEFPPQSLFDVYDALKFFEALPKATSIERRLTCCFEETLQRLEAFARLSASGKPTVAQVLEYQRSVEQSDIVTLGEYWTLRFLKHFGLLCPSDDPFIPDARQRILDFRAEEALKDPVSRSLFHRAQCAWQLGLQSESSDALADGLFESGEPVAGAPASHGLYVCRLRHTREGDAEVQALCAALDTSVLRSGRSPPGLVLNLHLSDVPCVSCLGCTLQFQCRFPGVLRVSFDRGRVLRKDSVPIPRPPPPPSKRGNPIPYAPMPDAPRSDGVDRSMLRKELPEGSLDTTSFYLNPLLASRRPNGASKGGEEAVPHKLVRGLNGNQQTYYFSSAPTFFDTGDYESY